MYFLTVVYLWRNVYLDSCPIFFKLDCLFSESKDSDSLSISESKKFFIYCTYKSLMKYMIDKYLLPFCELSFIFLKILFIYLTERDHK